MKIFIVSFLLSMLFINLSGQWYSREYQVSDINFLSKEQLEASLKETNSRLLGAGLVAVAGGLGILAGKLTLRHGLDEDASWFEEIMGARFMGKTYIVLGAGLAAGGTIAGIVYLGRRGNIKSALYRNYGLDIEPSVIQDSNTGSLYPGVTLTLKF